MVLKQSNGWTRGTLANHIWSFADDDDRADINATFLQPLLTYTTPTQWTFALNTESTGRRSCLCAFSCRSSPRL